MKIAMLLAPSDFRDETVSKARRLMERWGVEPIITSYSSHECTGYHGAVYRPGIRTTELDPDSFEGLFLVDGSGVESYKLYDLRHIIELVKSFAKKGKFVVALGDSMKILARADVIDGIKVASVRDREGERIVKLFKGKVSDSNVECDRNILTATSSEDTEALVDLLLEKMRAK